MLCTVIWDVYRDAERRDVWQAIRDLIPQHSADWSQKGIYAYWEPDTNELLYVGLAASLPSGSHNTIAWSHTLAGTRRIGSTSGSLATTGSVSRCSCRAPP